MNKIKDKNKIEVFYNDSCPVCKREIEIYKSKSEGVEYRDSSEMDDKFNRRMHAFQNGIEYKGAEAFIVIWKNTNGFKWLGHLLNNKLCIFFMNLVYEPIAFYLYKMHLKRRQKK
tara:strand:- start:422 stop:766 length:345 start_codon:yes stop_codon:yes gene_type:complete